MDDLKCPICDGKATAYRIGKHALIRCIGEVGAKRGCGLRWEPADMTADEAVKVWVERFGD